MTRGSRCSTVPSWVSILPSSTFKTTQALTYLTEGIITPSTLFPCHHGFYYRGLHVGCHGHASPLNLVEAISTSCNGYFCWGLYYMMSNRRKYKDVQQAMNTWRDYMVSMGFGYKLGIDLPGEKRGLIPNAEFYDNAYKGSWNGLTIISIAIGQGEVNLTPLQIANLGATIANRGYYYTPHVVKSIQERVLIPNIANVTTPVRHHGPTEQWWRACGRRHSKERVRRCAICPSRPAERQVPPRTAATTTRYSWDLRQWTNRRLPSPYM